MVSLMTLKGLEAIAEKEIEKQADRWIRALASREGVDYDELRPHVVALYYNPECCLEITFVIPRHTPIQVWSDRCALGKGKTVPKLVNGKLVGDYHWMARIRDGGGASFSGVRNLGHALLLSRWAHDGDVRAEWAP